MSRLSPFAYQIARKSPDDRFRSRRFLLAVSGGTDSVALMPLFREFQTRFACEVLVAHVHHGSEGAEAQVRFRHKAQVLVEDFCNQLGWEFIGNQACRALKASSSEADYREFRRGLLFQWAEERSCDHVVLAHHYDDLFETRLIRLIRGTGPMGLRAMSIWDGLIYRPFLDVGKNQVAEYAQNEGFDGVEDPENENSRFLRSWLRKEWLPRLESYRPGASSAMARSLARIVESLVLDGENWMIEVGGAVVLDRKAIKMGSAEQVSRNLALYVQKVTGQSLTATQINEVVKRLGTEQKSLVFQVGGCHWEINAEHVKAIPL